MLTIENLTVRYGGQVALSVMEPIEFCEGDRIGMIGSNGAGKTTLVKSVLGLTNYSGRITTNLATDDIAVLMQQNNYVDTMPVKYIIEAVLDTNVKDNERLKELIAFFDFNSCMNKRFSSLSGGQKQRMTVILVLMQDAKLTLFDEVTSGLDFETRQKLMDKICEWYDANRSSTFCIVSHYYDELERLVDKLLILEKGNVVAYGKTRDLFSHYCGDAIITLENTEQNESMVSDFTRIGSPHHLIAVSCRTVDEESALTSLLIRENVNYKRSNTDVEILFINAVSEFYKDTEVRKGERQ